MKVESHGPKRLTNRPVAQGDDAALAVLIGGPLRVGTLQGVHVDFRHEKLPAAEWEALPWWYVSGPPPHRAGLLFPKDADALSKEPLPERLLLENADAIRLEAGDRITIERVDVEETENGFDHAHDRITRLAHLRIERGTGEVLRPTGPLAFFGTGRIRGHGTRESFDHVMARILSHAGVADFPASWDSSEQGYWGRPLERVALHAAADAHKALQKLLNALPPDAPARSHVRKLVNNAALAGFLLGKVEAQEPTRRAERQIMSARETAAGKTPQALLRTAREIAERNPDWNRSQIATELMKHCEREKRSLLRTLNKHEIGPPPKR